MRFVIAGGGTGGHIYPALAIARALERQDATATILFVGTEHGLESELVPHAGYPLQTIHLYGFQRRISWRNFQNVFWTVRSLWEVRKILRAFRPDAVIGTGGYVCGPVVWSAASAGIPTLIQEQNAFPGVTNRILSRVVDVAAVGYPEAAPKFAGHKAHVVVTGNPVREDLLRETREDSCRHFGLRPDSPVLLITGGSQGARSVNQAALALHRHWAGKKEVQILHITGQTDYNNIIHMLQAEGLPVHDGEAGRIVVPYLHEMPKALAAARLVVSRAGAIGLAELTLRGIPSILVPYPYASENHQEINARALEKNGAAVVIRDSELTGELLTATVEKLIADSEKLRSMAAAAAAMGTPRAADDIAALVFDLLNRAGADRR
ncbi:MAG: undecaprenyldiphospho-muramoylpentapeptide beta-N-acetylglucosaminyltransferase [Veillonellaceae bacterium]|nr:undecaprenyldiphospho-muramoylpentapeptide beta-N-acetylglucosaminyltransferase [Veillonellaceae bacterium]